jgi:hypothetical protein
MESFREQRCRTCRSVFWVCRRCDRGDAYCNAECRGAARAKQVRRAKRKYLADPDVREGEAERLREYRARVRDQGSKKVAPAARVPAAATGAPMDGGDRGGGDHDAESEGLVGGLRPAGGEVPCARCGRRARFVRFGPLRAWRRARWKLRARAP